MTKYKNHEVSSDGWTDWIEPLQPGYRIKCCDCGLVHDMEFRVSEGKTQFRARRNERSTAMVKRHAVAKKLPVSKPANITQHTADQAVKSYLQSQSTEVTPP